MNNVTEFPGIRTALPVESERELGPLEARGAMERALQQSLLALEIAERLHQASLNQARVFNADVPFAQLPARTAQHFRTCAEQAIARLDTVKHRLAIDAAERLLKSGRSFEEAVGLYFGALVR